MADNFLCFSEVVPNLSEKEIDWFKHQLKTMSVFEGNVYPQDELPDGVDVGDTEWCGYRGLIDFGDKDLLCEELDDEGYLGCNWSFEDDEDGEWGRYLWVHADVYGWTDPVVHLIQKFLRECRPNDCWSLSFAEFCSKPRASEFGGGAVFVTAEAVKVQNSCAFREEHQAAFEGQRLALKQQLQEVIQ